MNKQITKVRLEKETAQLERDPIPGVLVQRVGNLHFHFCLYDLQEDYTGGIYHGLLELSEDYPFAPPKLFFFTPSGRFAISTPICTTFTNFHREMWSATWNVRSLITATISFMYANEPGVGGLNEDSRIKKELAKKSYENNLKNEQFLELFRDKLIEIKVVEGQKESRINDDGESEATPEQLDPEELKRTITTDKLHVQEKRFLKNQKKEGQQQKKVTPKTGERIGKRGTITRGAQKQEIQHDQEIRHCQRTRKRVKLEQSDKIDKNN